jgi:hypothetical protein
LLLLSSGQIAGISGILGGALAFVLKQSWGGGP